MDRIEHEGIVTSVDKDFISVEIVNKSACAGCHAKSVCAASDSETRIIEIAHDISTLAGDYQVGDKVNVVMKGSLGVKALWICFVLPLAILLAAIFVFYLVGFTELQRGLWALACVAVYYIGIIPFRKKLSKVFTFSIEKFNG